MDGAWQAGFETIVGLGFATSSGNEADKDSEQLPDDTAHQRYAAALWPSTVRVEWCVKN